MSAPTWLKWVHRVQPKGWPLITHRTLRGDVLAGWVGALLVVPQSVAFSTLAGLPPSFGLVTAVVPCIVAALAGSSWHVVTGPTNALSLALLAMLAPLATVGSESYIALAVAATMGMGIMQWVAGRLKLGALANYISPAALLGFTTGAAVLIVLHALQSVLGMQAGDSPQGARTHMMVWRILREMVASEPAPLLVALATLVAIGAWHKLRGGVATMLVGLTAGSLVGALSNAAVHATGATWFGQVSTLAPLRWTLPHWQMPQLPVAVLPEVFGAAAALAVVALAQSVGVARVLAERSGQNLQVNREISGQGLANMASACLGGYVACGSISRSIPSMQAGARTPLAAVLSALMFVALMMLGAPLLSHVPQAAIGAALVWVGLNFLSPSTWMALRRASVGEFNIALATLAATLLLRLEVAVVIGSALSLGYYLQRTSKPAMPSIGFDRWEPPRRFVLRDGNPDAIPECPQLKMLRMGDSVFYAAVAQVQERLLSVREEAPDQHFLLVMAASMNTIDTAGSRLWLAELRHRRAEGGDLYFHRPREAVIDQWLRDGFLEELGADNVFDDKRLAIAGIVPRLNPEVCAQCRVRVFKECAMQPGGEAASATALGEAENAKTITT